jgi:hypothetical protein
MAGVHDGLQERGESSYVLEAHLHFGSGSVSRDKGSRRGFANESGDNLGEPLPELTLPVVVDNDNEWDQLC